MSRTPTSQQLAIYEEIKNGTGSLIITARAGAGKTSTIVEGSKLLKPGLQIGFAAFNKNIAEEMKRKLPPSVTAMTMNAIGNRALKRYLPKSTLNSAKLYKVYGNVVKHLKVSQEFATRNKKVIIKLASLGKITGITPKIPGVRNIIIPDTTSAWMNVYSHFDLSIEIKEDLPGVLEAASKLAAESLKLSLNTEYDFDDQIVMPVIYGWELQQFDVLFIDEAQDTSDLKRAMLLRCVKKGGRVIAVGDDRQTIYGFAGASTNSMAAIQLATNAKELKLSCTFRCPQAITAHAREIVPDISCMPSAKPGTLKMTGYAFDREVLRGDGLVLSRFNAPLMTLAIELYTKNIPFAFDGSPDIVSKADSILIEYGPETLGADVAISSANYITDRLMVQLEEGKPVESLIDAHNFLVAVGQRFPDWTCQQLREQLQRAFAGGGTGITLTTIHKAKGLEADRVFFLNSHDVPSKYAKSQWQLDQEENLRYVAITRSKDLLEYITVEVGGRSFQG